MFCARPSRAAFEAPCRRNYERCLSSGSRALKSFPQAAFALSGCVLAGARPARGAFLDGCWHAGGIPNGVFG
eukprot:10755186-Alexandrium_andersonii.AAC.1